MVKEFKEGKQYRSNTSNADNRNKGSVVLAMKGTTHKTLQYMSEGSGGRCSSGRKEEFDEVNSDSYNIY